MSAKAQSSSCTETEPDGSGAFVIDVLKRHWKTFDGQLYAMLGKQFGNVHQEHDEIIGSSMALALERAAEIEQAWRQSHRGIALAGWVYNFIRRSAEWGALNAIKKWNKNVRIGGAAGLLDEEDDSAPARPVPIHFPDQEEILFLKQLIEKLGRLQPYELAWLRTVTDRATLSEVCATLPAVKRWMEKLRYGEPEEAAEVFKEMRAFSGHEPSLAYPSSSSGRTRDFDSRKRGSSPREGTKGE